MRSSHHFMIGKSHDKCEDYAYSCGAFAALSDGCSVVRDTDGNKIDAHTDVGARLLVRAAFHHKSEDCPGQLVRLAVHTANGYRTSMGMPIETLSATLICVRQVRSRRESFISGDGVMAARDGKTGRWSVLTYQYDQCPYYPRYILGDYHPDTKLTIADTYGRSWLPSEKYESCELITWDWDVDLIVCISDGAFSFTRDSKPVPFDHEFAMRLLDFRRMGGNFMVRHLRGVLAELEQDGIVNQDDISMVALYKDE